MTNTQKELVLQIRALAYLVEEDPLHMPEEAMKTLLDCLTLLTGKHLKTEMSIDEVARYFKVTSRTIYRWQRELRFPKGEDVCKRGQVFNIYEIVEWKKANSDIIHNKQQ